VIRDGFSPAADTNTDGWDGYYAQIGLEKSVETVVTIDDDFEQVAGIETNLILSPEEFATSNGYLGY